MKLRLFAEDVEVALARVRVSVTMATAMLCAECSAVYEAAPPHTCPRCLCAEAVPLANLLGHPVERTPAEPGPGA